MIGKVNDFSKFKDLIIKFLSTEICRDKNGFVKIGTVSYPIKYDDFIVNTCNNIFLNCKFFSFIGFGFSVNK